jgi:hypothetical protein
MIDAAAGVWFNAVLPSFSIARPTEPPMNDSSARAGVLAALIAGGVAAAGGMVLWLSARSPAAKSPPVARRPAAPVAVPAPAPAASGPPPAQLDHASDGPPPAPEPVAIPELPPIVLRPVDLPKLDRPAPRGKEKEKKGSG